MPTRSLDKDPLNQGLLLSIPMFEGTGTATVKDVARPHHPITQVHAPAWTQLANGLWVMDFDGANDYLSCAGASCTDLNFLVAGFSAVIWIKPDTYASYMSILGRSVLNTSGWRFYIDANRYVRFRGSDANQTISNATTAGVWILAGFSHTSTSSGGVRIYINGIDEVWTPAAHILVTSAADFIVAFADAGYSRFDGKLWNPRIWGRALSPSEHMSIFKRERHLFNV